MRKAKPRLKALDFFAGSGLVTEGLQPFFDVVWANDNCQKKRRVYEANFGEEHLDPRSISEIRGSDLPFADLGWASFPCQDLSLAGNMKAMKGSRSSLYYQWLRVLDEIPEHRKPPVLCAENVIGFLVAGQGRVFKDAYWQLRKRGYLAGALVADAAHFVPQSRPRAFMVAVREAAFAKSLASAIPETAMTHKAVWTAFNAVKDPDWIWWQMPEFPPRALRLSDLCEFDAPVDEKSKTDKLLQMLSEKHKLLLDNLRSKKGVFVGAGYKRMRKTASGQNAQRLEIRFDGLAGCLRTPNGGSSRQIVLIVSNGEVATRLMTIREAARLMGARDSYLIPGSYNQGYWAMGDAVAVPVTQWLAGNLLAPLARTAAHPFLKMAII